MNARWAGVANGFCVIAIWLAIGCFSQGFAEVAQSRMVLRDGWQLQSSGLVKEGGERVSTEQFTPEGWHRTSVPTTVLAALTRCGVYPDMRIGLNCFRIPDASDEFNKRHDLARYSHLPDKRNPWKDPYWYRTEFQLPSSVEGKRVWLVFQGINYRADVWLNGTRVADREHVVGAFSRYRIDATGAARPGKNCLAVKIHPVDHPGVPDSQFDVFGKVRNEYKEIRKDLALVFSIGYDCMPHVPDRTIGIWQDVYVETTGAVAIRDPWVVTDLPLPKTDRAMLTVSAELVNATSSPQKGVIEGVIVEAGVKFRREVELSAGQTKQIVFTAKDAAQLVIENPRLWWPKNYGSQNLYHLDLSYRSGAEVSDCRTVTFGVRKVTKELYELDGSHGLRLYVNGQRIFCRGGYIQPEVMHDWDARRMETEVRYLTEANMNLAYFEDVANPPDEFFEACDKYGLMMGNCYYGCWWMTPGSGLPSDLGLLERSTIDITKRYRNHPSLVLCMAMNEGDTREDVYEMWRKHILALDGTRLFIPSGSYPDYRSNSALAKGVDKGYLTTYTVKKPVPAWVKKDLPAGMNDFAPNSYGWVEPEQHYRWVRECRNHMFMMEGCAASLPPVDSLRRFLPDLWDAPPGPQFPLTEDWAHHGANGYYKPYDEALRRLYGEPASVEDYCMKGHLVTADQHRAIFEAVNHRMWDITSGRTQWKVNACWPDVNWQVYDWFLKPMVSYYYIKKACEPVHVQLCPLDSMVTLVNNRLGPKENLEVEARVYDFDMKLKWRKRLRASVAANSYREVFAIEPIVDLSPVYFVKLEAKEGGKVVSDNFYWLSAKKPAVLTDLAKLGTVCLKTSSRVEIEGDTAIVHAVVENPTDRLAFFIHLAATRKQHGEEIVPVFWDDNYFSLLPGESREVCARLSAKSLADTPPALEVSGWNIQSDFDCGSLEASKSRVKANEAVTVTASIGNTSLDGSRVELLVDDRPRDARLVWARTPGGRKVVFALKLAEPGIHRVRVGDRHIEITVQ